MAHGYVLFRNAMVHRRGWRQGCVACMQEEEAERDAAERRQAGGASADGDGDATMVDAADAADDAADALLAASRGHSASVAQRVAGGGQTHAVNASEGGVGGGDGGIVPPAAAATGAFEGVLIDGFRVPEVRLPSTCTVRHTDSGTAFALRHDGTRWPVTAVLIAFALDASGATANSADTAYNWSL